MSDYLTPNLSIPLASSYNERGINGFTTTITNAIDQRKINCFYEIVKNSISGSVTSYLTKRPGILDSGNTLLNPGTPYLFVNDPTQASNGWAIGLGSAVVKATNESFSTTILNDGNTWYPCYVDTTNISATPTVVLQVRRSTGGVVFKTFYSSAIATWTEITDSDLTSLTLRGKMEHLDGYALQLASDNYVYNSDLNSLSSWTANNKIQKSIQQDTAAGLAKLGQKIIAFGNNTAEVFINTGNPTGSPLSRVPELAANIGLDAVTAGQSTLTDIRHYYTVLNGKLYFVANSQAGRSIHVFNGSSFEKVSTPFIDRILAGTSVKHIQVLSFFGNDAIAINLSLTSASTQIWLMFFPAINEWFEWTSAAFQPVGNGTYLIGAPGFETKYGAFSNSGAQAPGWVDGTATAFTMSTQFMLKQDNALKPMSWCGLLADTAASTSNVGVSFSDDDYATFSTPQNIDLSSVDKKITRCGSFRSRAVRLTHSANLECRIEKFLARIG